MQVFWWMMLVVAVALYIWLSTIVFPKLFFKGGYDLRFSHDRGLRNYKENNGRSILYEPKPEYRKYINQYIISERNGKKVITSRLEENITYIDYDVVLFDKKNRFFKTINIVEKVDRPGYSHTVDLPEKTSFASVIVNNVNGQKIDNTAVKKISKTSMFKFACFLGFFALLAVFFIRLSIANIFGDVFANDYMFSILNILANFLIAVAIAFINMAIVVGSIHIKNNKEFSGRID